MPLLPTRYSWWQEALSHTLAPVRPGSPVVFFIDNDELREIAPDTDADAATDLAHAVGELASVSHGQAVFGRVQHACTHWAKGPQTSPPPSLPILALTVLAATRMRSSPGVRATNFFLRFSQALHPDAPAQQQDSMRTVLRGPAFNPVVAMWQQLDKWFKLDSEHRGTSTITTNGHFTRIGYPLSQALIRLSDRATLTRFFLAAELRPAEIVSGASLVNWLSIWRHRDELSPALRNALSNTELRPMIEMLVADAFEHWDGEVATKEGLRRLDLRIAIDSHRWAAKWVIPLAQKVHSDILNGLIAERITTVKIAEDEFSQLYRVNGLPDPTSVDLSRRFILQGEHASLYFTPQPLRPFVEDPDAGGWMSTPSIRPFEEHVILVVPEHTQAVARMLSAAAEPGWKQVKRPLLDHIAFERVMFIDKHNLAAAIASLPPALRAMAVPETAPRARLARGLKLTSGLNHAMYLAGGEPDLILPAGPHPRAVQAALDGVRQKPPFQASPMGFPIELRRLGALLPGVHELDIEGTRLNFIIHDPTHTPTIRKKQSALGWDEHGTLRPHNSTVNGANTPMSDEPEPLLARRGKDATWTITAQGIFRPHREPVQPRWINTRLAGAALYYFPINVTSESAWLAQKLGQRWTVKPIHPALPGPIKHLDSQSWRLWRELSLQPVAHPAWSAYIDATRSAHVS